MSNGVHDLRSALDFLARQPGQLVETNVEADPNAEISGIYRYVGAGGTVARPTKEGPAMVFNNVKGFPDARVVIGMLASRRRVGLLLDGRLPAREGAPVFAGGEQVGVVTSGGFSPSLERPIAMAYVDAAHAAQGTALEIEVRGRRLAAAVAPMPFVPHKYHRQGA